MARKPLSFTTKTQALSTHIAKMARQLGPGAKLPTMQQLSSDLGISVMTLNRALSELEAQGLVVRLQGSGTYVTERVSQNTVGLVYDRDVFGAGTSPFRALLLHEAQRRAETGGERFSLFMAEPSPGGLPVHEDLADAIRTRRVSGLLFAANSNSPALPWILKQNVPVVALAYAPIVPHRVKIDHAATVKLGVKTLAEQGCKRIALWIPGGVGIGRKNGESSFEELEAFVTALKAAKLAYLPELVLELDDLSADSSKKWPSNREQGQNAAQTQFASGNRENWPDGVISLDDDLTRGALAQSAKMSVKIGEDVKMATHSNKGSHLLWGFEDVLTRIEFDPAQVAGAMFGLLETLMRGDTPAFDVVSIEPKLV